MTRSKMQKVSRAAAICRQRKASRYPFPFAAESWWVVFFIAGKIEQIRRQTEEVLIKIKTDTEELDKDRRTREEKAKKERANKI